MKLQRLACAAGLVIPVHACLLFKNTPERTCIAWLTAGRHKALASLGMPVEQFQQQGILMALSELTLQYKAPLRSRDVFYVTTAMAQVRAAIRIPAACNRTRPAARRACVCPACAVHVLLHGQLGSLLPHRGTGVRPAAVSHAAGRCTAHR